MRITNASLAEVRLALNEAYQIRQFGSGGESAKASVNSWLEDAQRVIDTFPDAEFALTAEIFEPARATKVMVQLYPREQANYILTSAIVEYAWTMDMRMVTEPITVLAAPAPHGNG